MRAVASVPPPAPQGTITVTGRAGYACARAGVRPNAADAAIAAEEAAKVRREILDINASQRRP